MRRFADALIGPIRVQLPADPDALFRALVESVNQWRGHQVNVIKENFPPHTATGIWLPGSDRDDIIIEKRAEVWHQIVILSHEVWHMHQEDAITPHQVTTFDGSQPAAARTVLLEGAEQDADEFGMLVGRRLRTWLEASAHSVYAAETNGTDDLDLTGRIGAALNYRGKRV